MLPRPMDIAIYAAVVLLFAVWSTVHVVLCVQLAKKDWKRAAAGFVAFPLAPYFGQLFHIRRLPAAWVASASLYFLALLLGLV